MKAIKNILRASLLSAVAIAATTGCNTDPEYYSQVVPDTFFTSKDAVWQRYCRPITHWKWHKASDRHRFDVMELGTDEICIPTRNGDWYNGGTHQNEHYHVFPSSEGVFYSNFYGVGMGVALAWDAIEDITTRVDLNKVGITQDELDLMVAQLNMYVADLYKDGLDMFGGYPLYSYGDKDLKPRATDVETFEFIEDILKTNIPKLPVKETLGGKETSYVHRAWGAAMLAQLYFNAVPYTDGKKAPMWAECAKICEDIINGVYGPYDLGKTWNEVFARGNENCPEIIYGIPSDATYAGCDSGQFATWFCYNTNTYFGGTGYDSWNGAAIQPSYRPDGTPYTDADWKLGRVMQKFEDTDLRKQQYTYEGGGKYSGMFFMGRQVNKSSRAKDGWVAKGGREYKDKIVYLNDCIARFALGNPGVETPRVVDWTEDGKPLDADGKVIDRSKFANLPSSMEFGEEASGYRLMKLCPPVDQIDYEKAEMRWPAMTPVCRLTEIYYMLAECYFNMEGRKGDAVKLINKVRARNFEGGKDPNPVTEANLDKYRLADEWMIEFLGESRRRTDLIRWGMYVTEDWWDHKATNNKNLNRFPIPDSSLASNNLLEQNPGY